VIAAAAVAMGIGQAADAASVRYDLQYVDSILDDAVVFDSVTGDPLWVSWDDGPLSIHDSPWETPDIQIHAQRGGLSDAYLEIEMLWDDWYQDYIPSVPNCYVGAFDCSITRGERAASINPFYVAADRFSIWQEGSTITVTNWGEYHLAGFTIIGDGYWGSAVSVTSTYEIIELAPVPLPASAALLPLGVGALALMRRRRKA
jgi:hypothetical protein